MKQSVSALLIGSALLIVLGSAARAQTFLGQAVEAQYFFPDLGTLLENDGTQTVTAGGVTYDLCSTQVNTEVLPTQIIQTYTVGSTFNPSAFNGVELSEVGGTPATITGVTVDATSDLPGFVAGDVTFDATDIFINDQSIPFDTSNQLVLDVGFGNPNSTPEPGAFALLMGVGLSGAAFLRRKRIGSPTK